MHTLRNSFFASIMLFLFFKLVNYWIFVRILVQRLFHFSGYVSVGRMRMAQLSFARKWGKTV